MKNLFRSCIFGATLLPMGLSAASFTASIESFRSLRNFDAAPSSLDFRIATLVGEEKSAESTHILLHGLMPLGAAGTYSSTYQAINVDNNSDQDAGTVYLKMPGSDLPEGAVASPVVGIMSRAGSWDAFEPVVPSTTVGGSSGTSSYDAETGQIELSLRQGEQTFTGSTAYTAVGIDILELDPVALTSGSATYNFHETVLYRDGDRYYGVLESADLGVDYSSVLFAFELTDFPDVNGNSIPDITDPDLVDWGTAAGYYDDSTMHWVYYFGSGWAMWIGEDFNSNWGYLYVGEAYDPALSVTNWVFHLDRGWIYFLEGSVTSGVFIYSLDLGWLVAAEEYGAGQFYRYDTESFETWVP